MWTNVRENWIRSYTNYKKKKTKINDQHMNKQN